MSAEGGIQAEVFRGEVSPAGCLFDCAFGRGVSRRDHREAAAAVFATVCSGAVVPLSPSRASSETSVLSSHPPVHLSLSDEWAACDSLCSSDDLLEYMACANHAHQPRRTRLADVMQVLRGASRGAPVHLSSKLGCSTVSGSHTHCVPG